MRSEVLTILHSIEQRDGVLTKAAVVAAATDPDSPLHGELTWDDEKAATRYRLIEAGELIRSYRVIIEADPDKVVNVRGFVHVPERGGYVSTETALSRDRDVVLAQLKRDIAVLRRKYQAFTDFVAVLDALDEVAAA